MPRILIAGCGYVGEATADLFQAAGWDVEGWVQSKESATSLSKKPYCVRVVDISQRAQLPRRVAVFDAVVHCVSSRGGDANIYRHIYLNGARNLVERFPSATILFTSSTSVYAQRDGSWVTEESEAEPLHQTSRILLEVEKLVLDKGGTVLRLGGIYGPGRSALLTRFLNGTLTIDLENDRFVNQIHRDDIASAVFLLLNRKQQDGAQIYNIVDDQPILQSECCRWLAQRLNRPLPSSAKSEHPRRRGDSNKRVSNAKLRRSGWTPQYPTFADAMEKSILSSFREPISELSC
jgi:nucleoside-diphosphate-sugar epimerase